MLSLTASLKNKYIPIQYQIIERKEAKVFELHGEKIYDYFYWLKDDSKRKDRILKIEEYTLEKYINQNKPNNNWQKIRKLFNKSLDYELCYDVQYVNWFIFYKYLDFSKSIYQPIFKRVKSINDKHPHIVFDSNNIENGSVVEHEYSPDGKYCAFGIDEGKPHSCNITVVDVESGKPYGKRLHLRKLKKVAWSGDSRGFFVFYDPDESNCPCLYYHFIDEHIHDIFIAKIPRGEFHKVSFEVSNDKKYLILCNNQAVFIANIESLCETIELKPIFKLSPDVFYEYVGNEGEYFTFLTNDKAPKHHIIEIEIGSKNPDKHFEVIVAENLDNHGVLTSAFKYSAYLFLVYIENVQNTMYLFYLSKNMRRIEYKIQLENEQFLSMKIDKVGFFFETQSFKVQRTVYRIDFNQLQYRPPDAKTYSIVKPIIWKQPASNLGEIQLKIRQDSFISFDGISVPMTIIEKNTNDLKKPCLVFAYGGFGCAMLPFFKLFLLLFEEIFNGIIVVFHIRGGGDLGDDWLLKPWEAEKSFDDLIAGVEHLKGRKYANIIDANKIAYYGVSHGGLTGAVVMNRKRNLFRSVIIQNANLDLINDLPCKGCIWAKQYELYPVTLVVASKNDETVAMENSLKYVALRREMDGNNVFQTDKPTLLKTIHSGGHHYETAEKSEFIDTVFVELKFIAESMELQFDRKYYCDDS
ncbi:prolyl endopeptidase-like [Contarinia nasturtii]|uniref:prolyl endopeptidase-like n=1 Tax=Contarinia nasturtii TaxID=265458 RepID=UPI0012D4403C|nr:prolyl endopeptidase-like [Contarinia nasturtii]